MTADLDHYVLQPDDSLKPNESRWRLVTRRAIAARQLIGSSQRPNYVATIYDLDTAKRICDLLNARVRRLNDFKITEVTLVPSPICSCGATMYPDDSLNWCCKREGCDNGPVSCGVFPFETVKDPEMKNEAEISAYMKGVRSGLEFAKTLPMPAESITALREEITRVKQGGWDDPEFELDRRDRPQTLTPGDAALVRVAATVLYELMEQSDVEIDDVNMILKGFKAAGGKATTTTIVTDLKSVADRIEHDA